MKVSIELTPSEVDFLATMICFSELGHLRKVADSSGLDSHEVNTLHDKLDQAWYWAIGGIR